MKFINLIVATGLLFSGLTASGKIAGQAGNDGLKDNDGLGGYVNTFIGTSNFGTTNPGAVCPNGMMSVTPFNVMGSKLNTWDKDSRWWSTPYSSDNCFFTG